MPDVIITKTRFQMAMYGRLPFEEAVAELRVDPRFDAIATACERHEPLSERALLDGTLAALGCRCVPGQGIFMAVALIINHPNLIELEMVEKLIEIEFSGRDTADA